MSWVKDSEAVCGGRLVGIGRGMGLITTVAGEVGNLEGKDNCLSYPQSKFDNIRAGIPKE